MMKVKSQIKKYINLFKNFGVSFVILEFILRVVGIISTELSIWKLLSRKKNENIERYLSQNLILDYKSNNTEKRFIESDCYIWVYWAQGIENAPLLTQKCVNRIKDLCKEYKVVVLDLKTINKYLELPQYVIEKYRNGIISQAHFSDILRMGLLQKYGGIWIDSTVYIKDDKTIKELHNFSFYSIKHEIGKEYLACHGLWSTFFLAACKNDDVVNFAYQSLLEYWKTFNFPIDYLLLDSIIYIGYQNSQIIKKEIDSIPINNVGTFALAEKLINGQEDYKNLFQTTSVFKLTYKYDSLNSEAVIDSLFKQNGEIG